MLSADFVFREMARIGRARFAGTPFVTGQPPSLGDVDALIEVQRELSTHSPTWNGTTSKHVTMACAIANRLTDELCWPIGERALVYYQVATHDIGRLVSNEIIVAEEIGLALLRAFRFQSRLVELHFGWEYWCSDAYRPELRSNRDRIVFLADVYGKPGTTPGRVRTYLEVVTSIQSLPQRYADSGNELFYRTVELVVRRCCNSVDACLDWMNGQGVCTADVLASVAW